MNDDVLATRGARSSATMVQWCLLTHPPAPWCRGQRSVPTYPSSCSIVLGQRSVPTYPSSCSIVSGSEVGAYLPFLLLHGVGVRGRCQLTLPPAPWCRGQRSVPTYPSSCSMVSGSEVGAYLPFLLLHGVRVRGRRLLTLPLAPWRRGRRLRWAWSASIMSHTHGKCLLSHSLHALKK